MAARDLLRAAVLCVPEPAPPGGDPAEAALEAAAEQAGVEVDDERLFNPRLDTLPPGPGRPLLATLHIHAEAGQAIYLRGASAAVVARCGSWLGGGALDAEAVQREAAAMAAAGLRVLAVALRIPDGPVARLTTAEVEDGCALYGLVGLGSDPPP